MLPELTATGKENGAAAAAASTADDSDGASAGKKRRVASKHENAVDVDSNADAADAGAEQGEGYETYESLAEATSSANFWKNQYYALHREKDSVGMEQKLFTLKELSEKREAQLKRYMFDVERRLKEATDELAEIKKAANASPASSGDILDAFPSATESPLADANDNGKIEAETQTEAKATSPNDDDNKHEEEMNQMKEEMNELSSTVNMMQQIISHYKMLTAVKLINVQSGSFDVQIRNFQRSASATFRLTYVRSRSGGDDGEGGSAEIELRLDAVDGAKYLPEFMRSPIEFGVDQCPTLLREALATMFPEERAEK